MVAATAPELGRVSSDGGVLAVTARALERSSDWEAVAAFRGTVVVFMGERRWHDLTCRLVAAGRRPDEPAAAFSLAAEEQVVTANLATIATVADDGAIEAPAVLVIGDVSLSPSSSLEGLSEQLTAA